jgi:hypothetical protein
MQKDKAVQLLDGHEQTIADIVAGGGAENISEDPAYQVGRAYILEAMEGGKRAAPAPTAEPARAEPVWQWWAGTSDESYSVGPCATREKAIEEAFGANGIDPNDPETDRDVSIHVVEAIQPVIDLADFIDLAEIVHDDLEDGGPLAEYQSEDGDPITEMVTDPQWKDLQARFGKLIAQWQADHSIVLRSWVFSKMRNAEQIWPPQERAPAPAPQSPAEPNEVSP